MSRPPVTSEHDAEPIPGLPGRLPANERMLWQGAPSWRALARGAFHTRKIGVYFALLAGWRAVTALYDGGAAGDALVAALVALGLGALAIAILWLFAWLMARTTIYTLTTHRMVFRIGVALPMTVNVPFSLVEAARVRRRRDGSGDLSLLTVPGQRVSYLVMWPHVRPWRLTRSEPMLRALPEVDAVAERVAAALRAHGALEAPAHAVPARTPEPARAPAAEASTDTTTTTTAAARAGDVPLVAAAS